MYLKFDEGEIYCLNPPKLGGHVRHVVKMFPKSIPSVQVVVQNALTSRFGHAPTVVNLYLMMNMNTAYTAVQKEALKKS